MGRVPHPSIERLERIVLALGDIATDVVFIGGALAPLLQEDPPFEEARPTKDVDAVIASTAYEDLADLAERLRELGFGQDLREVGHVHRWLSPYGDILDLVPAGDHFGGSGSHWDQLAIVSSVTVVTDSGVPIRHASAPAFLAMKWAAHNDRGAGDPFTSHDLEDILALLASRPAIANEVEQAPHDIGRFVSLCSNELLRSDDLQDLLSAHLNNAQEAAPTCQRVHDCLRKLAGHDPT